MHHARRSLRNRVRAFAAIGAVAAVLAAVLVPMSAQADTVALSGTVRNAAGVNLSGVTVTAINMFGAAVPFEQAEATTSSTGAFAFAALPLAEYTLSFSATSNTYFQYLGDTSNLLDGDVLYLLGGASGQNHTYLGVVLAASGSIAGRVSKLPSGAVASYTVRAFGRAADGSWSIDRSAITGSTGAYTIGGLEPGAYRLEAIDLTSAHPLYPPLFFGGTTDVDSATTVGVVANRASAVNFVLGKAGSVSGAVSGLYDGANTERVAGVHVTVYRLSGSSFPFDTAVALDSPKATTASNGTYSVTGLAPGNYTLEFTPPTTATPAPGSQIYGRTFLGDKDSPTAASYFSVGNATAVSAENVQLRPDATVSGTLFAAPGQVFPVGYVRVSIDYAGRDHDVPGEHPQSVVTDSGGTFSFRGLGPGNYDLWVGTNVDPDPVVHTTWIRQIVHVPGPLVTGGTVNVQVEMTMKDSGALIATTAPAITDSGTTVGDELDVDSGTWNDPAIVDGTFLYQWLRDGAPISGATGAS
jgi:hypothetical protein